MLHEPEAFSCAEIEGRGQQQFPWVGVSPPGTGGGGKPTQDPLLPRVRSWTYRGTVLAKIPRMGIARIAVVSLAASMAVACANPQPLWGTGFVSDLGSCKEIVPHEWYVLGRSACPKGTRLHGMPAPEGTAVWCADPVGVLLR